MLVLTPQARGVGLTASNVGCQWCPNCPESNRTVRHRVVWSEANLVNEQEVHEGC